VGQLSIVWTLYCYRMYFLHICALLNVFKQFVLFILYLPLLVVHTTWTWTSEWKHG